MSHYKFSANLGYLWKELPFLERIRQAASHGFAGVEFHDDAQHADPNALKELLSELDLPVYGLNVRMGETFGCAAIPEMSDQAKRDIDHAARVADDIGARAIHVLSGRVSGQIAHDAYLETLGYALENVDQAILIEPVSAEQVPGYFLRTIEQAAGVIAQIGHPRLKILFDCYHIHQESGDVAGRFKAHAQMIGHVQIAAVENRAEPFPGLLDYRELLAGFQDAGYKGPFGCEYRPAGTTQEGLAWRERV